MKLKKIASFVTCAAMAGVFATSAFAASDASVQKVQSYLDSKGIAYTVTAADLDRAKANGYSMSDADAMFAKADALLEKAKTDPEGAKNEAISLLASMGVTVTDATVTVNGDVITITATVNGTAVAKTVTVSETSEHPEIAEAIANGTWGVSESTTSAATSQTSSSSVIKATGDDAAIAMLIAVVAIASTMGVAVRKSSEAV